MMGLFVVSRRSDEPLYQTVARALEHPASSDDLAVLPTLTNVALGDPYLAQQLAELHHTLEIHPPAARSLAARLRARLAWWLLGPELRQINPVHAGLVRVLDSLVVQLDQERAARRRIEEHLAALADTAPGAPAATAAPANADAPPHPLHLVWHSSFAAPTGYSSSARAFVLGLDAHGVQVRPLYLYGTDRDEQVLMGQMHPRIRQLQTQPVRLDVPQVVYAPGDRFHKNSGSYRIGYTMLEVDRLPAAWVEQANQMHEVWTPTAWGAEMFRASGVQRPVHVLPLGVDGERFMPGSPRGPLAGCTVFLSVFEWGIRKGWDVLLRAYRAAFRPDDDVLLLLKVDCRQPAVNPVRELAALLPEPSPPVGVLYNETLSAEQLVELYQGADCFVLPTRGEGWGMPILEAMACGTPAIATDWSGPTTFLTHDNGYPLPIRGLCAATSDNPYYQHAQWAEPDEAALVDLLRHVAAHPAERQHKGAQSIHDAQQWTWERAVKQMHARLAAIGEP
jgi:glycosyltransferase involved in cell wall biosynthesis